MPHVAAIALLAGGVTFAGVLLIERFAHRLGLVDMPNERSSHTDPRPRGAGLAIIAGVLAAIAAGSEPTASSALGWLFGCALVVAGISLIDDLHRLPVLPRLAAQFGAALVFLLVVGPFERLPLPAPLDIALPASVATALAVIWIAGVTNFFNFMDGADGLAGGQAVLTYGALAFALWPGEGAVSAIALAAAAAAFLNRNWYPARVFLGDVGSAFLGFLLAALPFIGPAEDRHRLLLMVAVSLWLFLFDPTTTLLARLRRRAAVGTAHREHAYQRLFAPTQSHAPSVGALLAAGALLTLVAVAAYRFPSLGWASILTAMAVFAIEWHVARART